MTFCHSKSHVLCNGCLIHTAIIIFCLATRQKQSIKINHLNNHKHVLQCRHYHLLMISLTNHWKWSDRVRACPLRMNRGHSTHEVQWFTSEQNVLAKQNLWRKKQDNILYNYTPRQDREEFDSKCTKVKKINFINTQWFLPILLPVFLFLYECDANLTTE